MDRRLLLIIAVAAVLGILLGFINVGSFLSNATIQSISSTTLNGKPAFLITAIGGSGADGIIGRISQNSNPAFTSQKGLEIGFFKSDDKYIYRLTERTGATKTINTLTLIKECYGSIGTVFSPLTDCFNPNQPWSVAGGFSSFSAWCVSQGGTLAADTSPAPWTAHFRCYILTPAWIIADLDKVGGIYEPKMLIAADVYSKDHNDPTAILEKHAELYLTRTNTQGILTTTTGENIGQAVITGMALTFTAPPPSTSIVAVSPPSTPRNFRLATGGSGGIDFDKVAITANFDLCKAQALAQGTPATGVMSESVFTGCVNTYNAYVNNIAADNPVVGDFARSDIQLDTNAINTNGTITIKNSFALPQLTMWVYADSLGVARANAVPVAVSCTTTDMPEGASSVINARITNGMSAGVLYWSAFCGIPITVSQATGQVNAGIGQSIDFTIPISSGTQQGTSSCTVTGKSTDLQTTVIGICNVQVSWVCNNIIPVGCHLQPTQLDPCAINCTVIPAICSDGTLLGHCNVQMQRCNNVTGTLTLQNDATCTGNFTPPLVACYPFIQKISTQTVGGVNFLGMNFGGTQIFSCVWDFTTLGIAMIAIALILYRMGRIEEGKAVGIAALALIVLSFVADNSLLLALGGAGIFLIAVVVAIVYLVIRLHLI